MAERGTAVSDGNRDRLRSWVPLAAFVALALAIRRLEPQGVDTELRLARSVVV